MACVSSATLACASRAGARPSDRGVVPTSLARGGSPGPVPRRAFLAGASLFSIGTHPASAAPSPAPLSPSPSPQRPSTVVYVGLTLDGYLARPDGAVDYLPMPSDPSQDYGFAAFMDSVDAVLMGRRTFQQVLQFCEGPDAVPWPYEGKTVYVISRTITQSDVPSNLTGKAVISAASPAETLRAMRREGVARAYVDGGSVVRALLEDDLVDEMVLTSVPVLIGRGQPLFGFDPKGGRDYRWRTVRSETFRDGSGFVKTAYARQRTAG